MARKNPYKFEKEVLEFGENIIIYSRANGTNTITLPKEAVENYNLKSKRIKSIRIEFEPNKKEVVEKPRLNVDSEH